MADEAATWPDVVDHDDPSDPSSLEPTSSDVAEANTPDPDAVPATADPPGGPSAGGFLPPRPTRGESESVFVRLIATAGIVGIGTALGAILGASDVEGWIVGLAVAVLTVGLAALLWRSRTL